MTSFADSIRAGVKRGLCSVISTVDTATALIRRKAVGDVLDDVSFPAFLNRLVCDRDMPPTVPPPPFTGGQCCDAAYQVTWTYTARNKTTGDIRGPFNGGTLLGLGKIVSFDIREPRSNLVFLLETCNGAAREEPKGELVLEGEEAEGFSLTSVTAYDGNVSGDCGDPPPLLKPLPPGWNTYGDDISYTNNEGVDITVPFVAAFGYADIDVNGSLSIPVKVDVGGIKVDVNFNLNTGDIQFFPTNNYPSRKPGNQPTDYSPLPGTELPEYPDNLPLPLPDIDEEDKDTEPVIVGAVVTALSVDNSKISTLFQDDNPSIKIPSLGHISFLCRVGFMESAWTRDIPVKNVRNIIECPWPGGAIRVAGTPQPGVQWEITPLYSRKNSPIILPIEETV